MCQFIANMKNICSLLDNNNLSGTLPPDLYKLPKLLILYGPLTSWEIMNHEFMVSYINIVDFSFIDFCV
jgi:hypothetical protein